MDFIHRLLLRFTSSTTWDMLTFIISPSRISGLVVLMWNIRCMYILLNDCGIYLYFLLFLYLMFYLFGHRVSPCDHGSPITRYPGLSAFALSGRAGTLRTQIPRVLPWARRRLPFQGVLIPIVFRRDGLGVHFPIVFRRGGLDVHFPIAFRRMLIHWLATFAP